jgi:hypothetical protein
MRTKVMSLISAAVLLGVMSGCEEEEPTLYGDLHAEFRVGSGSQSCEDAGIAFIRVDVLSGETPIADETVVCNPEEQSVIFPDIVVGSYTITVSGLNDQNEMIYRGESSEAVDVLADQTNGPFTIVLDQLRPSIMVWFGFSDVGGCERFEVSEIVVILYENGASSVYDETFICSERVTDALLIEDLSETSTYDVRIRGANGNSEFTYEYDVDGVTVSPGPPTEISAELTSCSGVCEDP